MHFFEKITAYLHKQLEEFHHSVASVDALPQLALLGLLCGLASSALLVAFRLCSELPLWWWFGKEGNDFETLSPWMRFAVPTIGGILIGLWLTSRKPEDRPSGPAHLLERMNHFQGHVPFSNMVTQFWGATLSLLSGQSIGREGPAVYLGGTAGSLLAGRLKLPNNSRQTLIGCGVAAAIAAAFNTPLAGVIFAMEVILMEYTIVGFIPIIIAAVTGTFISRLVFGTEPAFALPSITSFNSLEELPYIVFAGIIIGICGTIHMRCATYLSGRQHEWSPLQRMFTAGLLTGIVAIWVPEVMGLGYDTLEQTLAGSIGLNWLMAIFVAKIALTSISIGLGMPAGLIGPSLVMGGCLGGIISLSGVSIGYIDADNTSVYVLLGMAGMMGAILNAPLAALIALMELTYNPNIIMPGLLLIAVSSITNHHFFGNLSLFQSMLKSQDKLGQSSPVNQYLNRTGVIYLMEKSLIQVTRLLPHSQAESILKQQPCWIVVQNEEKEYFLLKPSTLFSHLAKQEHSAMESLDADSTSENTQENINDTEHIHFTDTGWESEVDLLNIPGDRFQLYPISSQASLLEALREMDKKGTDALYITSPVTEAQGIVRGIITRNEIDNYYKPY